MKINESHDRQFFSICTGRRVGEGVGEGVDGGVSGGKEMDLSLI